MPQPEGLALSPATRPTWRALLDEGGPLLLPAAHDALTARLITRAGFRAFQVGGFALAGARYAFPDINLVQYYEENEAIRQIVAASPLPVLVDAGDGFGDVKNVTRTVRGYEELGVAAIFIEDQKSPISCGQMGKKEVIPTRDMPPRSRRRWPPGAVRRRSSWPAPTPGAPLMLRRRSAAGKRTRRPGP